MIMNGKLKIYLWRAPSGRAIRCKPLLVPRCGLFTTITHADAQTNTRLAIHLSILY
jgi:hypothetical protein